jgi:hypothetical protein
VKPNCCSRVLITSLKGLFSVTYKRSTFPFCCSHSSGVYLRAFSFPFWVGNLEGVNEAILHPRMFEDIGSPSKSWWEHRLLCSLEKSFKSALHVEFRLSGCLASLCATSFDEFIGYAKVPKEGWRYMALARRHHSLLEFGTFGKRDNIQSAIM